MRLAGGQLPSAGVSRFSVDTLKIDCSFVEAVATSEASAALKDARAGRLRAASQDSSQSPSARVERTF
jgi:hypothetical protein